MSEEISGFQENFSEFRNLKRRKLWKISCFYKNRSAQQCYIKISVKLVEIRVFSEKIPENPQDVKSQIPGKKVQFSGFFSRRKDTAYFWKIRGKKFPGKSDVFGGKFPENLKSENSEIGKFRKKKCQNVDFGKFNPRLQSVLKRTF
jgi:hypothetical protein